MPHNTAVQRSLIASRATTARARRHDTPLDDLLEKLYARRGWDFRNYKKASVIRRIDKRLNALNINTYEKYSAYLDKDQTEYASLFSTLMIKVSEFFRDPEVFAGLESAFKEPHSFKDRIKVWCCGCATGEEAFSLAILLEENLSRSDLARSIVYATDLDFDAISQCRTAEFRTDQLKNVSKERLARHFIVASNAYYMVNYQIRSRVRFGALDIVTDNPLSCVSVISCRNLLIYFDKTLQEKVFRKFHFALAPGGLLVLGLAEAIPAAYAEHFEPVDSKLNIFRKKSARVKG